MLSVLKSPANPLAEGQLEPLRRRSEVVNEQAPGAGAALASAGQVAVACGLGRGILRDQGSLPTGIISIVSQ